MVRTQKIGLLGVAEVAGTDSVTVGGKFADVRGSFGSGRPHTTARAGIRVPISYSLFPLSAVTLGSDMTTVEYSLIDQRGKANYHKYIRALLEVEYLE